MPLTVICDGCGSEIPTRVGLVPDAEGDLRPMLCPGAGPFRFRVTDGEFLFTCDDACMFLAQGAADAALLPKEKKDDA